MQKFAKCRSRIVDNHVKKSLLKGLCHEINIFVEEQALIVFAIFGFLVDEKIKLKVLSLILKILPVTDFKEPKAAILTLKMLIGSRL